MFRQRSKNVQNGRKSETESVPGLQHEEDESHSDSEHSGMLEKESEEEQGPTAEEDLEAAVGLEGVDDSDV